MSYQGDYAPAATVVFNFNTVSFADGSPITLAGTPALSVYKNSTTESTSGITLTVDYDSRTGMHHVVIDTSADGTFYAAGNDFDVIITTGTVGGTSVVGRKVGSFSLNNRSLQTRIPAALVGGRMDASVGAMAANTVTASALAADAVAEIKAAITDETLVGTSINLLAEDYSNNNALDCTVSGVAGDVTGNVNGKVLGGGAGTITGTGARVVDDSGNAVAPASATTSILEDTGTTLPAQIAALNNLSAAQVTAAVPTAAQNAAAWGARVIGNGRTADMYLQGLTNRVAFAADGLTWTLYSTDDATPLYEGTATRLATDVGGLRAIDPT